MKVKHIYSFSIEDHKYSDSSFEDTPIITESEFHKILYKYFKEGVTNIFIFCHPALTQRLYGMVRPERMPLVLDDGDYFYRYYSPFGMDIRVISDRDLPATEMEIVIDEGAP